MQIEQKNVTPKIYLLTFNTQRNITSTLLRFQEHYESPEFRGKIFTLEEYKKWYIAHSPKGKKTNEFTYYSDWNGYNIPSYILQPFYEGKFDPLSEAEKQILEIFKGKPEPFYIIGVHKEAKMSEALLSHEIAHGLFYTDDNYRKEVTDVIKKFDTQEIRNELLSKAGYHPDVLNDEVHAYSIDSERLLETKIPEQLSLELREIYKSYLGKNKLSL